MKTLNQILTVLFLASLLAGCDKTPVSSDDVPDNEVVPETKAEYFYNPVLYENAQGKKWTLADPSVWKGTDGRFYAVATHIEDVIVSDDMINWSFKRDAINEELRDKYIGMTGDYPGGHFYAPDVVNINGNILMYVRVGNTEATGVSDKGSAVAVFRQISSPGDFHFEFVRYIIASDSRFEDPKFSEDPRFSEPPFPDGLSDSSDPEVVIGEDGRVWLFYGGSNGIHRIELTSNGLEVKEGATLVHVAGNKEATSVSRDDRYEGAYLHYKNGYWYMFASVGKYDQPNYGLVVGRSETLDGEFKDHYGNKLTDANAGKLIGAKKILGSDSEDQFWGPGHNGEIFTDATGQDYIFYHSHDTDKDPGKNGSLRYLMLQRVFWDNDGWPYFTDGKPAWRDVKPAL